MHGRKNIKSLNHVRIEDGPAEIQTEYLSNTRVQRYRCINLLGEKKYIGIKLATRPRWPRGLRCRLAAARLLGLRVRIPPGTRMYVSCECSVLSGRGLCDGPITHPKEYYRA